ncbi:hypothetical protein FRB96_001098 [Tulasnella sp. 330]|nr:hypothetical protein FRB96_001098 [Tulasnella sp. 330]KAG8870021.1 hypothetical protein FRB97_000429 [Tulasnella sp. 331]KAG8871607.1 hypothetical protein FRB98_000666 [Tulasnella sp. 332]
MERIYDYFGIALPFDGDCTLVTSNIVSSRLLGIIRLVLAIYTLVTLIVILVWEGVVTHVINQFFSYFTDLSYIGLCAYFWASAVQTLAYSSRPRPREPLSYPLQSWPRVLQLLHVLLNCTVWVAPFIVTVVFWVLLADHALDSPFNAWHNISVHILNSLFAITDIVLSRFTPQWSIIPVLILILGLYIALAYLTFATQHFYTYGFLDPRQKHGWVAVYVLAMIIATLLVLAIVKGICRLRDRAFDKEVKSGEPWTEMGNINTPEKEPFV